MSRPRDIRNFFGPVARPSTQEPSKKEPSAAVSATRTWPAPRTASPPVRALQSRALPTIPAKRSADGATVVDDSPNTTPPRASQGSSNTSFSKKVTLNGRPVVLNSDSDSDSEELEVIEIQRRFASPKKTPASNPPPHHSAYPRRVGKDDDDDIRLPAKRMQPPKRSLHRLGDELRRNAAAAERLTAAKAELELELDLEHAFKPRSESAMSDVLDGDEDKRRLHLAMQRTQTSGSDCIFQCFKPDVESPRNSRFPIKCLPNHGWVANFQDVERRDQSFLYGFAQQMFQMQRLPEELADWMVDQISYGTSEALAARYTDLLSVHPGSLRKLDPSGIEDLFARVGADVGKLQEPVIQPTYTAHEYKAAVWRPLKATINLLSRIVTNLPEEARVSILFICCCICMDDTIRSDADTLERIHGLIEATATSFDSFDSILKNMVHSLSSRILDPHLQQNLITTLPVHTSRTALFRQNLALAFLVQPAVADLPFPTVISQHIDTLLNESPFFKMTRSIDHAALAARLFLLDTAIGPGLRPVPVRKPASPCPNPCDEERLRTVPSKRAPTSAEIAFNKEIDQLVPRLRHLINSISEANAVSNMSILDAKETGEQLCRRLEGTVRIGGRKIRAEFGDENQVSEASKNFMKIWSGRGRAKERGKEKGNEGWADGNGGQVVDGGNDAGIEDALV